MFLNSNREQPREELGGDSATSIQGDADWPNAPNVFDCSNCEGTGFVMSDEATWSPTECPYCS